MSPNLDWTSRIQPNRDIALMLAKREVSVLVHDAVALEGILLLCPKFKRC